MDKTGQAFSIVVHVFFSRNFRRRESRLGSGYASSGSGSGFVSSLENIVPSAEHAKKYRPTPVTSRTTILNACQILQNLMLDYRIIKLCNTAVSCFMFCFTKNLFFADLRWLLILSICSVEHNTTEASKRKGKQ